MAHVLGVSREAVFAHPELVLTSEQSANFGALWKRFCKGEPIAYLLNRKEFFGLEFYVDQRVLIPRPETEHLVEAVIQLVDSMTAPRILDLGTGSGAIALALQHALPKAKVLGADISEDALWVARKNAERLGFPEMRFFRGDLLEDLPHEVREVEIIVANLPYIGREQFSFVEESVERYEPHLALFAGKDGLDLYRRLFEQINCSNLKFLRYLVGEFGSLQRETLETIIFQAFPHAERRFYQDLAGLDRFFVIDFQRTF